MRPIGFLPWVAENAIQSGPEFQNHMKLLKCSNCWPSCYVHVENRACMSCHILCRMPGIILLHFFNDPILQLYSWSIWVNRVLQMSPESSLRVWGHISLWFQNSGPACILWNEVVLIHRLYYERKICWMMQEINKIRICCIIMQYVCW
jgi:hypothetical protein